MLVLNITHQILGANTMSREQKSNKENKKKPSMTPKEKKAAKKSKQTSNKRSKGLLD